MLRTQTFSSHSRFFRVLVLLFALLLGGLLLHSASAENLKGGVQFAQPAYVVDSGDVLTLDVYHQNEFDQDKILIRADGMASFNGIGELFVRGKTVSEIQEEIVVRLKELIREPVVTVNVAQTKPGTVYLSGAVKHPGMYQLSTGAQSSPSGPTSTKVISRIDLRLLNVLTNAGGVKLTADLHRVEVRRNTDSGPVSATVDLWRVLKTGDKTQDMMLQSGDSVHIPALVSTASLSPEEYDLMLTSSIGPASFPVRVIGEIGKPGVYGLNGESPYLNSAIAMAGGFKDSSNRKVIAIRRFTNENDISTIYIEPNKTDIVLRPNDIVFIGERKTHRAGRFFEEVNNVLSPFTNAFFAASIFGGL